MKVGTFQCLLSFYRFRIPAGCFAVLGPSYRPSISMASSKVTQSPKFGQISSL